MEVRNSSWLAKQLYAVVGTCIGVNKVLCLQGHAKAIYLEKLHHWDNVTILNYSDLNFLMT